MSVKIVISPDQDHDSPSGHKQSFRKLATSNFLNQKSIEQTQIMNFFFR